MNTLTAGRRIGNFRILRKLGEGGMGAVYHAVDEMVDRDVAIKSLLPEIAHQPGTLERFRTEAVALAKLNHTNVATLYSFLLEGDQYFMVIEYVNGRSLEDIIRQRGRLPLDTAVSIAVHVLDGLKHAHAMGILHRDIKPANILISEAGEVKVTDFGIARFVNSDRMTRAGRIVGTIEYMAPERILGHEADARSDIYSVGALLFEMLTGRIPFQSENEFELLKKQLDMPPPSLAACGITVPEGIERIVQTALAKQTQQRFESAAAMRAQLKPYLPEEATDLVARPARTTSKDMPLADTVRTRASRLPSSRNHLYIALGTLCVLILLAGLGLALRGRPEPGALSLPPRQVIIQEPVPPRTVELPPPPRVETAPAKPADPPVDEARRRKAMDALNQ
ncbi:MAG: serine/threonine protein kinase [Bryobacterales bacterium]|nr:serine/threonine protein kinase [Bryobacterales bacterium]